MAENGNSLVSVVVPVYNAERTIRRCIQSILGQTYSTWELIIVDDGSVDQSFHICQEYRQMYDNISLERQENSGPSKARNRGLSLATGKYIIFLDSDDFYDPDYLSEMVDAAEKDPYPDMVISGVTHDYYAPASQKIVRFAKNTSYRMSDFPIFESMRLQLLPVVANKLYRHDVIRSYGIRYDENLRYYEDFRFIMDTLRRCENVACVTSAGYHYCHYNDSLSHEITDDRWSIARNAYMQYIDVCKELGIYQKYPSQVEEFMWRCVRSTICDYVRANKMNCFAAEQLIKDICLDSTVKDSLKKIGSIDFLSDMLISAMKQDRFRFLAFVFVLERKLSSYPSIINSIKRVFRY